MYGTTCVILSTAYITANSTGSIEGLAFVVRVFDPTETVDAIGPKGRIALPMKDLYMFRYMRDEVVGFDPAVTREMHCLDPETGQMWSSEPGVRFASGADVIAYLQQGRE